MGASSAAPLKPRSIVAAALEAGGGGQGAGLPVLATALVLAPAAAAAAAGAEAGAEAEAGEAATLVALAQRGGGGLGGGPPLFFRVPFLDPAGRRLALEERVTLRVPAAAAAAGQRGGRAAAAVRVHPTLLALIRATPAALCEAAIPHLISCVTAEVRARAGGGGGCEARGAHAAARGQLAAGGRGVGWVVIRGGW
jgi:hypothetical protein